MVGVCIFGSDSLSLRAIAPGDIRGTVICERREVEKHKRFAHLILIALIVLRVYLRLIRGEGHFNMLFSY